MNNETNTTATDTNNTTTEATMNQTSEVTNEVTSEEVTGTITMSNEETTVTDNVKTETTVSAPVVTVKVRKRGEQTAAPAAAESTEVAAVRVLKHSETQEARREFIKDRVGEGTILHLTRAVPGAEGEAPTEQTMLVQVKRINPIRGRYGYTELHVAALGSTEQTVFNWRDDSVLRMEIADLNQIVELARKVDEDRVRQEAILEYKRAENARKSASRNRAKTEGSAPAAE